MPNLETPEFDRETALIRWHFEQAMTSLNRIMVPLESAMERVQNRVPLSLSVIASIAETAQMLANFQSWLASQSVMLSDIQVENACFVHSEAKNAKD